MLKEKELKSLLVIVIGLIIFNLLTKNIYYLYSAVGIGGLGITIPIVGYYIVWLWFKIGHVLGWINSKLILGVIYFFLLTPLSFLYRLGKKDPLSLKAPKNSNYSTRQHTYEAKDLENTW